MSNQEKIEISINELIKKLEELQIISELKNRVEETIEIANNIVYWIDKDGFYFNISKYKMTNDITVRASTGLYLKTYHDVANKSLIEINEMIFNDYEILIILLKNLIFNLKCVLELIDKAISKSDDP